MVTYGNHIQPFILTKASNFKPYINPSFLYMIFVIIHYDFCYLLLQKCLDTHYTHWRVASLKKIIVLGEFF
jgi:hypothetical protein